MIRVLLLGIKLTLNTKQDKKKLKGKKEKKKIVKTTTNHTSIFDKALCLEKHLGYFLFVKVSINSKIMLRGINN